MKRNLTAQMQREQLHTAAADGDIARVKELLQAKYPINCFDELEHTPLHIAVANEDFKMVDLLVRLGANVNAHDERVIGDTPLGRYVDTCSFKMAQVLIDAGADPSIRGWMQLSAIDRAKLRKDGESKRVLRLLMEAVGKPDESHSK